MGVSKNHSYQAANRFAWSWKVASLGTPVILVYLGFVGANQMSDRGEPFASLQDWTRTLESHFRGVVDESC